MLSDTFDFSDAHKEGRGGHDGGVFADRAPTELPQPALGCARTHAENLPRLWY